MDGHGIGSVEGLVAAGTLPHAVRQPVVNAAVAKHMAASLEDCVLEVASANRADHQILHIVSNNNQT
jgi:hypothetical protein